MAAKAIEREMYTYFVQLNDEQQKSVVKYIKTIIKGEKAGNERISIEQYNRELEEADRRMANGHFISHEDVKEEMKTW